MPCDPPCPPSLIKSAEADAYPVKHVHPANAHVDSHASAISRMCYFPTAARQVTANDTRAGSVVSGRGVAGSPAQGLRPRSRRRWGCVFLEAGASSRLVRVVANPVPCGCGTERPVSLLVVSRRPFPGRRALPSSGLLGTLQHHGGLPPRVSRKGWVPVLRVFV